MLKNKLTKAVLALALIVTLLAPTAFTVSANGGIPTQNHYVTVAHGETVTLAPPIGGTNMAINWMPVNAPDAWPAEIFGTYVADAGTATLTNNMTGTAARTVTMHATLGTVATGQLRIAFVVTLQAAGAGAADPFAPPVGDVFTDSEGISWRVLADQGNSRLIITEHAHGNWTTPAFDAITNMPYNALQNQYVRLGNATLRTTLNNWGAANLSNELRSVAVAPVGVNNDVRETLWTATETTNWLSFLAENDWAGARAGFTTPGARTQGTAADGSLFALSMSEANQYFDGDAGRRTFDHNANFRTVERHWWLRSPGYNTTYVVAMVFGAGNMSATGATSPVVGLRPALWITQAQ